MSYSILLDLDGSRENDFSSAAESFKRKQPFSGAASPLAHIFSKTLRRLVHLRKSNILKLLMASLSALCLLFLIIKLFALGSIGDSAGHLDELDKQTTPYFNDLAQQQEYTGQVGIPPPTYNHPERRKPTQARSSHASKPLMIKVGQFLYPNNLSYSLDVADFTHMDNVNEMQKRIRLAMKHSWDSYKKYAWGYDMLKPRSKVPDQWFDLGLTIVDSTDTLLMMGLEKEANEAIDWIETELNLNSENQNSNCFELTIRVLGGILSVYHLTARERIKLIATEMGDKLLHCYDTQSTIIPYSDIDLSSNRSHPPAWNSHSSLSEVASLQVEFRSLSQITSNKKFEDTTFRTSIHIHNLTSHRKNKLLPMYIDPNSGKLEDSLITLGARADSYYEYLLKQYLQTGIKWLEDDYLDSIEEINNKMVQHTNGVENYTYVAEMHIYHSSNDTEEVKYFHKMDHLVCFLPGTLALGYYHYSPLALEHRLKYNLETPINKLNSRYNHHIDLAMALARTCNHMYSKMGTGLAPEIVNFEQVQASSNVDDVLTGENQDELKVKDSEAHNILRPEHVESLFYLYHITGKSEYRHQAGQIFEAFEKYSRISSGYTPISDVRTKPPTDALIGELLHQNAQDRMESFWLSETLKYLYLTFCDDKRIVGTLLNNYVFNTEAHIMPLA